MTSTNAASIPSGGTASIALTSNISSTYTWIAIDNPNTTGESITLQSGSTLSNTIINTSSASGLTGDMVRAAYAASKAGLGSLTQNVAVQYGKHGIRCNAVAPGVIATPALEANVPKAAVEVYIENTLTPRLGRPEDIAAAVVFLASDAAAFITGQVLSVDGGILAHHTAMAGIRRLSG